MGKKLMKYRFLSRRLPRKNSKRIAILTGARQTGKTTLSRRQYPDLRYINLDAPENREQLKSLATFAWSQSVGDAIIDEAQKEPTVFEKVKYAWDDGGITFTLLTGSSQILLMKRIRESLAGRAFFYELWPLMQTEILTPDRGGPVHPPLIDQLLATESISAVLSAVPKVLFDSDAYGYKQAEEHILSWGGMPALLPLTPDERWEWLKNYGYTYLERDLADLARLEDLSPFRKFQKLSALRSGGLLNFSDLARDTGISVATARRYMEYLRISYQAIWLRPYHRNLTSAVVKAPKFYWTDVGILRQLSGFSGEVSGQIYENMVVAETVKWIRTQGRDVELYFYRTRSGMEVDLLIETSRGIIGMEIKSRSTAVGKDIRPMKALAERLGERWLGGLVVNRGDEIESLGPPGLWAVPSKRLFNPPAPRPPA